MRSSWQAAAFAIWAAVGLIWLGTALLWRRPAIQRQRLASRLPHLLLLGSAGLLLFTKPRVPGWLALRIVPEEGPVPAIGLVLTVAGAAVATWARLVLGGNWSGRIAIQAGHRLIQHGPYGVVRHPIYSGLLLAGVGTALAGRELAGVLGVLLAFVAWWTKAGLEDQYLRSAFGEAYLAYSAKVKALVPFVL